MKPHPLSKVSVMAVGILLLIQPAFASLKLGSIFGDNMVFQQGIRAPVWGWTVPGEEVTVQFAGQIKSVHADATGKWLVKLGKLKASAEPQSLTVECGTTITLTNILIGEVWLCSGQSNMEKPIGIQPGQKPVFNYQAELAAANHPQMRLFKVDRALSAQPLADLTKVSGWLSCDSNALDGIKFSAAAYFFGREILTNLNVPVGLVECSWGGTKIEPWTPPAGVAMVPNLADPATPNVPQTQISNSTPAVIYNAMIAPIAGFGIRGALWYQGESNCQGGTNNPGFLDYDKRMLALACGWRSIWDEGPFPFYFVEIAPFKYHGGKIPRSPSAQTLPEFWTMQSRAAASLKCSGMVVTTDLVDDLNDIHPRDKQSVGHRLALLARNKTYGENIVSSGPTFKGMKIKGDRIVLCFDHDQGGLVSRDGQPLNWFTIAGMDGTFLAAEAVIVGETVEVSASGLHNPAAVHFAWDETAQPNFCNGAGLPAEPFRTENPMK